MVLTSTTSNGDWRRKQSKRKNLSVTEKCSLIDPHGFLWFLLNPVGKFPQGKDPWTLSWSLENLSVTENGLLWIHTVLSCSFWTQSASSPKAKIHEHYPKFLKTCQSLKNVSLMDVHVFFRWPIVFVIICVANYFLISMLPVTATVVVNKANLNPVSNWKRVFDGSSWFSLVPFEPSRQASPGQRSLNIIPESWKPVSHWEMVFDGCT